MSLLSPADNSAHLRNRFIIPHRNGKEQIYFLGNSLGLQPKSTAQEIKDVLHQWGSYGVEAFFEGENNWLDYHDQLTKPLAAITGALPHELVVMNQLTVNLHLLLATFYQPSKERNKIICEAGAFPSDQYMLETQCKLHGLDPAKHIVEVFPRGNEKVIRTEDVLAAIHKNRNELALVFWGGVNYLTGQVFDIKAITAAAQEAGATVGFDLAHAAGNIELQLHEWNVDFAAWCSYKYLNSGPGGIAGAFIHDRYHHDAGLPRMAGWWGYEKRSRFLMQKGFNAETSAEGWQVSTPSPVLYAAHHASLKLFDEAGFDNLLVKGKELAGYLIQLLNELNDGFIRKRFEIITPAQHGCQVSILVHENARDVFARLREHDIFADWREPGIIRVAPVPLYNTRDEVLQFTLVLKKLLA